MKFYFDESGRFTIPRRQCHHSASIVVWVAVSELIEPELHDGFDAFVNGLSEEERPTGEPKGRLLKLQSRFDFCDLLARINGVQLTPITLDMNVLGSRAETFPTILSKLIESRSHIFAHESMRNHLSDLAKRVKTLSPAQMWRIFAWSNAFRESVQGAILFLSSEGHEVFWDEVRFEVDAVQRNSNAVENSVFRDIVLCWLVFWSSSKPLVLLDPIHTSDHPFVKNFVLSGGIDIEKLIGENIHFVDSSLSPGVQIADIAANIIFRAVNDLESKRSDLSVFSSLMRSCPYEDTRGPGFVAPQGEPTNQYSEKYSSLIEAMQERARWNS